jgi:hypothetical protein
MERVIERPEVKDLITPGNQAQQIGYGVEKAAEFMVPAGAVTKSAALLKAAPTALRIGGRAALEGAAAAGVAGVQTGGDTEAMKDAALTAGGTTAALGAVAAGARKAAPMLKEAAKTQYARVLNPTREGTKQTAKRIIPEMIERGIKAPTLKSLADRAKYQMNTLGGAIDDIWNKMDITGHTAQIEPLLKHLDDAGVEAFTGKTTKGQVVALGEVAENGIQQIEKLKATLINAAEPNPINGKLEVPVATLRKLRQHFDDVAEKAGVYRKTPEKLEEWSRGNAHKIAADGIREELAKATPDLAKLNKEFAFWKRISEVTEATMERRVGQAKPLGRKIAGAVGAGVGFGTSGPLGLVLGKFAMDGFEALVTSPAWGTISAVQKDRLAKALAKGSRGEAEFLITKMLKSAATSAAARPVTVPTPQSALPAPQ